MIDIRFDDGELTAEEYCQFFNLLWPAVQLNHIAVRHALRRTINVTAKDQGRLVGCSRILSDGYLFGTVTEVLVHPEYAQRGLGRKLLETITAAWPASLVFAVQKANGAMMQQIGWQRGPTAYFARRELPDANILEHVSPAT